MQVGDGLMLRLVKIQLNFLGNSSQIQKTLGKEKKSMKRKNSKEENTFHKFDRKFIVFVEDSRGQSIM